MKFGKSIRAEARNNRGLSFINFKYLKRILKKCSAAIQAKSWDIAQEEDRQFLLVLESELRKVGESYWKELQQISNLQALITQKLPLLDIQPSPETYTRMGFEQLQAHLQSLGGLDEVPLNGDCLMSSVKTSAALCEFCINLGKISARCKRLRRCVLWNAVAVVKILKKRQKHTTLPGSETVHQWDCCRETAVGVLSRQEWYCCDQLPRIVSIIETTTDELMQRLTLKPPSRDQYQCPICLDVVVDPVCLRTCGHRFCWACLCMAYCEKPEGTLERCPCCRAVFPLDPEAFEVDGILRRFLRNFFPEDQCAREQEQKENLRQRLEDVQRQQEIHQHSIMSHKPTVGDVEERNPVTEDKENHHCCPDCVSDQGQIIPFDLNTNHEISRNQYAVEFVGTLTKLSSPYSSVTLNGSLIRSATEWLTSTHDNQPGNGTAKKQGRGCRHELNVKQGKPSDVDHLAFTSSSSSQFGWPSLSSSLIASSPNALTSSPLKEPFQRQSATFQDGTPNHHSGEPDSSTALGLSTISTVQPTADRHQEGRRAANRDLTVVDSVIATLLCETPQHQSSPSPVLSCALHVESENCKKTHYQLSDWTSPLLPEISYAASTEDKDAYLRGSHVPTVSSLLDKVHQLGKRCDGHHADETAINDFLSESLLPSVMVSDPITPSRWMLTVDDPIDQDCTHPCPNDVAYYEAIDDEDDRIEEELLLQQHKVVCHSSRRWD